MVTGASTADAAVILIDATRLAPDADGQVQLLPQTRRHAALVHLLGLRHVVVAVNKMDAVGFASDVFESIVTAFDRLAKSLGLGDVTAIPMSALTGDNVVRRTSQMPWYRGPVLLDWLESVDIAPAGDSAADTSIPLRFAVQWVQKRGARADAGARAYLGRVGSGTVRSGQEVRILPSGARARVAAIETFDGDLASAVAGKSVAIRLDREVDVSRGDWLVAVDEPSQPRLARRVHADLAWLDAAPLEPQRKFLVRHGTRLTWARIVEIEALLDLHAIRWREANDLRDTAATLGPNDIARVVLEVQQPLPFDPYDRSVVSGAVVLIDATTNHTLAAGMLRAAVDA
jgi:sulfate adenylyltransferase subunit 1